MREETKTVNNVPITLPIGWGYDPKANRDDYASYLTEERGWREVMHHLHALTTVLAKHVGALKPKTGNVLHAFGGLGATAQVIQHVDPRYQHFFWERSDKCIEYLQAKGWQNVVKVEDSMKVLEETDLRAFDIVIFDPSLGTILSPGIIPAWDYMAKFKVPLTWVSDFACSKLHLNGRAYARVFDGVVTQNAESYAASYDNFLRQRGRSIVDAIRDSFEMYFVIKPLTPKTPKFSYNSFNNPIPRMV